MASFNYTRLKAKVEGLITKFGRTLTFYPPNLPNDESKPWRGSDFLGVGVDAMGVIDEFDYKEEDGIDVKRGDLKCYTQLPVGSADDTYATVFDPETDKTYRIVKIRPICPGPLNVLYDLQLRQ